MGLSDPPRVSCSISEMKASLRWLLRRGLRNGILTIEAEGTDFSLEVRKYLYPQENFGLNVCLSCAPGSVEYFRKFEHYCKDKDIDFFMERGSGGDSTEFLCVDFGKDIERAHELVEIIITKIFCISRSHEFFVILENLSPWDEEIKSPHQRPLGFRDGWRQHGEVAKHQRGQTRLIFHALQ